MKIKMKVQMVNSRSTSLTKPTLQRVAQFIEKKNCSFQKVDHQQFAKKCHKMSNYHQMFN